MDSQRPFHFVPVQLGAHYGDSRRGPSSRRGSNSRRGSDSFLQLQQVGEQKVHVGLAFMVFVEDYPFCIHLAVQKFLQKVTVSLEENPCGSALATVLPELVADRLAAGLVVEPCGILRKRKGRYTARLQNHNAAAAPLAQEPGNVKGLAATRRGFHEQVPGLADGLVQPTFLFGNG